MCASISFLFSVIHHFLLRYVCRFSLSLSLSFPSIYLSTCSFYCAFSFRFTSKCRDVFDFRLSKFLCVSLMCRCKRSSVCFDSHFSGTHNVQHRFLKKKKHKQPVAMHYSISRVHTHTNTYCTNGKFFGIHFTIDNNNAQLMRLLWKFFVCGSFSLFVVGFVLAFNCFDIEIARHVFYSSNYSYYFDGGGRFARIA